MGVIEWLWVAVAFTALQPILHQRMLDARRASLIARLEARRGSRVVLLVHRQETMGFLGFPLLRYIDIEDAEEVMRAIQLTDPEVPLDLVLHTPGGLVLASVQIARAIQHRPGKVTVFVPHYAMSGGTLVALAADAIVMAPHAVLGPVDPQIGEFPAASLLDAVARKPVADLEDRTLILADQARKAIAQVRATLRELVGDRLPPDQADRLAALLSEGVWTHDYAITLDQARALGLPASGDLPQEVLDLLRLYPQPVRRQAAVEYLPAPRHAPPVGPGIERSTR
jgi:ClpP class serine protease